MAGLDAGYLGLVLLALVLLSFAMTLAWAIQRLTGNSGWIDTVWSLSTGLAAALSVVLSGPMMPRRFAILLLVTAWSARLGWHIAQRTRKVTDDPRYRALIDQWGSSANWKLWSFLQIQALVGAILVACCLLAVSKPGEIGLWDLSAYALGLAALVGESIADSQLRAFKDKNRGANGICEEGLWGLSRHPNYFFEWLFWLAVGLSALSFDSTHPFGWLALIAPAMMYVVLVYGSGVPHSEAQMLRTRGERFADYQRRVPAFFPDWRQLVRRKL